MSTQVDSASPTQFCHYGNLPLFKSFLVGCSLDVENSQEAVDEKEDNKGFHCAFKDKPFVDKVPSTFRGEAVAKLVADDVDCIADQLSTLSSLTLPAAALRRHTVLRESALECSLVTASKFAERIFSSAIVEMRGSTHRRKIQRPTICSAAAIVYLGKGQSKQMLPQLTFAEEKQ